MKKLSIAFASGLLLLAGCSTAVDDSPEPTSSATEESSASSTSSSASTSTDESAEPTTSQGTSGEDVVPQGAEPQAEDLPNEQVAEPYVVECLFGTPGPSLMSDGTVQSTEFCGNQPGAQEHRDAEAAAGYAPGRDYSTVPDDCPAAICGYGVDENGNPNPSSGELQLMDGCEKGYISDANRCAAVAEKAELYGW